MPRLFPGMQSSTGGASVLGRNIIYYHTSGECLRIGKVISRAYFSISGCVKFALAVRGEKFALLSNTIFSLPPLVNIQRQLRLRRVSDCRITPTSPSSLSVASLSQRGFLSAALPSFRTEGVRNERALLLRTPFGHEWCLCSPSRFSSSSSSSSSSGQVMHHKVF